MLWRILKRLDESYPLRLYRRLRQPPIPNLEGDRDVEYSWIAAHLTSGPGRALDFGSGLGWPGLLAARRGFEVVALDLLPLRPLYVFPSFRFQQADILRADFPPSYFDLIINCSTIEHVGLAGRFGVNKMLPDGDLQAMTVLRRIIKPSGSMLLTIPVGQDAVFAPFHRVYGSRLQNLLRHWSVDKKEFWVKDEQNRWIMVEESAALDRHPVVHCYGLGLYVLRPADEPKDGQGA